MQPQHLRGSSSQAGGRRVPARRQQPLACAGTSPSRRVRVLQAWTLVARRTPELPEPLQQPTCSLQPALQLEQSRRLVPFYLAAFCSAAAASASIRPALAQGSATAPLKPYVDLLLHSVNPATAQGFAPASLKPYVDLPRHFEVGVPPAWERVDKMGAAALFEDPSRRSTSVGVTVNPVRVQQVQAFGTPEEVGRKLLDAERAKESTLSVAMLRQGARSDVGGTLLYDYEYELDSTRGRRRVVNTVTIAGGQLFILNGSYKCEAACDSEEAAGAIALLREVAASFRVLPADQAAASQALLF